MPLQNLTKENFWNEIQQQYPAAMKLFCTWIDGYKKENDWERLFNYGAPHYATFGWQNPKYHDLPLAMQYGIWLQFNSAYIAETKIGSVSIGRNFCFENITVVIECSFKSIQGFEIKRHETDGDYTEWWQALTSEQTGHLTRQYHEKYQLKLIRDLSDSEIKQVFNRRAEYEY